MDAELWIGLAGVLGVIGGYILGRVAPAVAILLGPAAAGWLAAAGAAFCRDPYLATSLAAILLLMTYLGVLMSPAKEGRPAWPHAVAKWFFGVLGVILLLSVVCLGGPFGVIVAAVAAGLSLRYGLIARETLATHVFTTIGASIRQDLPLPTALAAEAAFLRGKPRRVLEHLSLWLSQGFSLSDSLRRGYPGCPAFARAMVAAAEPIGQLPRAVAAVERELETRSRESRKLQPMSPIYPAIVVIFYAWVVLGLAVFVMPMFKAIFHDLGAAIPPLSRWMFSAGADLMRLVGVVVVSGVVLLVPLWIYLLFRQRRPERPRLLSRVGDLIRWRLPLLGRLERKRSLARTASFLRLALAAGATADEAIAGAARLDINGRYRRRLADWHGRVVRGEGVSAAARASGAGAPLAWAFDQQACGGATPAALEMLESFYRSTYDYLANLARLVFWPCVTLLLAGMVGTFVLAIFLLLPAMLNQTMKGIIP